MEISKTLKRVSHNANIREVHGMLITPQPSRQNIYGSRLIKHVGNHEVGLLFYCNKNTLKELLQRLTHTTSWNEMLAWNICEIIYWLLYCHRKNTRYESLRMQSSFAISAWSLNLFIATEIIRSNASEIFKNWIYKNRNKWTIEAKISLPW